MRSDTVPSPFLLISSEIGDGTGDEYVALLSADHTGRIGVRLLVFRPLSSICVVFAPLAGGSRLGSPRCVLLHSAVLIHCTTDQHCGVAMWSVPSLSWWCIFEVSQSVQHCGFRALLAYTEDVFMHLQAAYRFPINNSWTNSFSHPPYHLPRVPPSPSLLKPLLRLHSRIQTQPLGPKTQHKSHERQSSHDRPYNLQRIRIRIYNRRPLRRTFG